MYSSNANKDENFLKKFKHDLSDKIERLSDHYSIFAEWYFEKAFLYEYLTNPAKDVDPLKEPSKTTLNHALGDLSNYKRTQQNNSKSCIGKFIKLRKNPAKQL
jgi:hypothetical protein